MNRRDYRDLSLSALRRCTAIRNARAERRLVRSHTAGEQRLPRFPVTVRVGREKVHARKAVDLQVDEAWCSDPDSVGRAQTNAGDVTVDHVDVPENEAPVDERCPDSESHG